MQRDTPITLFLPTEEYKNLRKDYDDNYASEHIKYQSKGLNREHFCFSFITAIEDA